jgi:hypothetical protein
MNDDELAAAVKEAVRGAHMNIPAEQIVHRSRAVRARRRIPGAAAALGAAAAAAVAVTMALPASHPVGGTGVQLTAWTVTKLADGNISVTIRELKDPAGLQSMLRADGVPASVTFLSQQNPACRPYLGGTPQPSPQIATRLLKRVFPKPYRYLPRPPRRLKSWAETELNGGAGVLFEVPEHRPPVPAVLSPNHTDIVIDPSALPGNAGVQIASIFGSPHGKVGFWLAAGDKLNQGVGLPAVVYASPGCTGS